MTDDFSVLGPGLRCGRKRKYLSGLLPPHCIEPAPARSWGQNVVIAMKYEADLTPCCSSESQQRFLQQQGVHLTSKSNYFTLMTFILSWIWPGIVKLGGTSVRQAEKLSHNSSLLNLQNAPESARVIVDIYKCCYYNAVKLRFLSDDPMQFINTEWCPHNITVNLINNWDKIMQKNRRSFIPTLCFLTSCNKLCITGCKNTI